MKNQKLIIVVIRVGPRAIPWVFTAPVCGLIAFFHSGWIGSLLVLVTIAFGVLISQLLRRQYHKRHRVNSPYEHGGIR